MRAMLLVGLLGCSFDSPGVDWWDRRFAHRREILVSAEVATPAGYSVSFVADTRALVMAGRARADARDWRIVRRTEDGLRELDRWIDDALGRWDTEATRTWFQVPAPIAGAGRDEATWLYYGALELESDPPAALDRVFVLGDDFEQPLAWTPNGRNEAISRDTGTRRGGAAALRLGAGGTPVGGVHRDVELPFEPLLFSHHLRQATTGSSFGHLRSFSQPFDGRAPAWNEAAIVAFCEIDSSDRLQSIGPAGDVRNWYASYGEDQWRHIEVVHDIARKQVRGRVDGGAWTEAMPDYPADASPPVRSIALEGEGQGGTFWIDNYVVRRFVEPEPSASLGPEQAAPL